MIYASGRVVREPWLHEFAAHPEEVAQLRRMVRLRLILWGLQEHVDAAQICVSELVTNVIQHVGEGTPTTLRMELNRPHLRVEVVDPDPRALPTLLAASTALESGRGMALVDAVTDHRWGVTLRGDTKVVWCELTVDDFAVCSPTNGPRVTRASAILELYGTWPLAHGSAVLGSGSRLNVAAAEEAAIEAMADLLHWLRAHGHDPDDVLDRAQTHFEAEIGGVSEAPLVC
ncbi:ATP-binding protein [Streptomyces shenzhenensis]|uniref:ATP-binding protein n=1 Tax=Streptomyces shenzhenensis TaxID=943815 RepID=UPI001F44008C|nr:ATP-binding protein [Streptomyces shenzhenensis]